MAGRCRQGRWVGRVPHDRINLPCERDKFGAQSEFAKAWITGGSMRYSPLKQKLLDLWLGHMQMIHMLQLMVTTKRVIVLMKAQ